LDDPAPPWSVRVKRESIAAISRALPPASAALLAGLLLGDHTDLPRDVDDAFRRAGVYHVLAVSGFNVGILAASVWALCRLLRLPHRASAATAIVVVIGFAMVVGPEPSVLRAVVMAVLVLVATLLDRDASVTNSLALAALAILAVRPDDPGARRGRAVVPQRGARRRRVRRPVANPAGAAGRRRARRPGARRRRPSSGSRLDRRGVLRRGARAAPRLAREPEAGRPPSG